MSATTAKPDRGGSRELAPDLLARLRRRLASSPAIGWLHPVLEEISMDRAVLKLPYREEVSNGSGTVHGGILATLADRSARAGFRGGAINVPRGA